MCRQINAELKNFYNLAVIFLILIGLVLGCSSMADVGAAQAAVDDFHSQFNAGKFDRIYENTSAQFRSATSKDQLIGALNSLEERMGNVEKASQNKYEFNTQNGATIVDLEYETTFSKGKAIENFQYQKRNGKLELNSYEYKIMK